MTSQAAETVECPKCFGVGSFRNWSHYASGRCFQCGGAGTLAITDKMRAAWAAEAERNAAIRASCPKRPSKTVTLAGFGSVTIERVESQPGDDYPQYRLALTDGRWLMFQICDGTVCPTWVCDGLSGAMGRVLSALQAAHRG